MITRKTTLLLAFATASMFVNVGFAQSTYHLIPSHQPLVTTTHPNWGVNWISGGSSSEILDINDSGDAVGYVAFDGHTRYARWSVGSGPVNTPTINGVFRAISGSGAITGIQYIDFNGPQQIQSMLLKNGQYSFDWGCNTLEQGLYGFQDGVNARVGVFPQAIGNSFINRGRYTTDTVLKQLAPPAGAPTDSPTHIFGINNNGLMVGDAVFNDGKRSALIWDGTTITKLGVPNAASSTARSINDSNEVVGSALVNGVQRGFTYFPGLGFLYPGAIPGSAVGSGVEFKDINNGGIAVGTGQMSATDWRAVVTVNGVTRDLNTMVATGGWVLESANAINNHGVIVGTARHQGTRKAFILVPEKPIQVAVNLNDFAGPSLINTYLEVINEATGQAVTGTGDNLNNGGQLAINVFPEQFRLRVKGRASLTYTSPVYSKSAVPANQVFPVYLTNGDVDSSGEIDAADIDVVIAAFGQTSAWTLSDVDGSGEVDAADIDIVIANFGETNN